VTRTALSASLLVVGLTGGVAFAQNPAVGQLPLPGDLYGYSPLVRTIDPFPTRTSGYAYSMFLPGIGGKRIYPPPVVVEDPRQVIALPDATMMPAETGAVIGPVQPVQPARGWHRFRHR
jgi:hypothetical protein